MKVADVMTRHVETVQAEESVAEAASIMRNKGVGALPVYMSDVLIGMITDRDITVEATAIGLNPNKTKVESVMSWYPETCREDDTVDEAARIMEEKGVRRLIVLGEDRRVSGIVTVTDLAGRAHRSKLVEEVLTRTSHGPVTRIRL
ncbi:MAG: Inosine-5'-monophosphate dehydrogenase [Candidatus Omnitrophica bacterium]|nr:Inosine-5'-monophosphate dehydrogenase [Candidatus Omnitrophota bacterium]